MTNCIISLHLLDALKTNTEISQGGVGSYLCHQDMELIDFRKALQLKWSTDFISGTRWNFEGEPGSHTSQILTNK